MTQAIRKHVREFVAILALIVVAGAVASVILSNERLTLPGWVPLLGKDFYTLKGEFTTAQAVTPGQGQTVDIAGVKVGEISDVQLHGGRAVVTMKIKPKYSQVYRDAHLLLRPKTGLKDMLVELSPGTRAAGRIPSGGTIPVENTLPDINLDEILASLDSDTRDYLRLLLGGAGQGLRGQARPLSAVLRRFDPTARDLALITGQLSRRRGNIRRLVHNFQLLSTALGAKEDQLAEFVDSSSAVFRSLAAEDSNLRRTIALLPGSLGETRRALGKADRLARVLGPTLGGLRPAARALGPALRRTRPFLRDTTPVIRDQLRPFSRDALPTVRILRPTLTDLSSLTPKLVTAVGVVNYLLDELAHNPPGDSSEGFLFWVSWLNHTGASLFSTQDAQGPYRRGLFIATCATLDLLGSVTAVNDQLKTLADLTNTPHKADICPATTGTTAAPPAAARKAR